MIVITADKKEGVWITMNGKVFHNGDSRFQAVLESAFEKMKEMGKRNADDKPTEA